MKHSYAEFIRFCKNFQTQNEFEFQKEEVMRDRAGYMYNASYRDEANYKANVRILFNHLPIRRFLPQYTVLATTWHIDDIRDRFSAQTTDEALFEIL